MKFTMFESKLKLYHFTLTILLLISFSHSAKNRITSKTMAPIIIQDQLDLLINKLEDKEHRSNQTNTSNENDKKVVYEKPSIRKSGLIQDEVVDALKNLNKDFVQYDMILSKDKNQEKKNSTENITKFIKPQIKNDTKEEQAKGTNENNVKTVEGKKEENIIVESSKNYLQEVNELTNNIDDSLSTFDTIEKYKKEKKVISKKIKHINSIKGNVDDLMKQINAIKKNKKNVEEKISKIKETSKNLMNQYHEYLELQKIKDKKINEDFKNLKKDIEKSVYFEYDLEDFFKVYTKLANFSKTIFIEHNKDLKIQGEKFSNVIEKVNKKDKLNSILM